MIGRFFAFLRMLFSRAHLVHTILLLVVVAFFLAPMIVRLFSRVPVLGPYLAARQAA